MQPPTHAYNPPSPIPYISYFQTWNPTYYFCASTTLTQNVLFLHKIKKRFPPILRTHTFPKLGLVLTSGKVLHLRRHLQLLSYWWRRVERYHFICTTICIQTLDKKNIILASNPEGVLMGEITCAQRTCNLQEICKVTARETERKDGRQGGGCGDEAKNTHTYIYMQVITTGNHQ